MKYYNEDHFWVEVRGDEATVGLSEYESEELGEITFVELPEEEEDVIVGDPLGTIESDAVSIDVNAPISGTIVAVNDELADEPGLINESPEDKGWIFKLNNIDDSELSDMMNVTDYRKYLRSCNRR